jgi:CubicO group peptidase (beta-lactamase class C family)
MDAYRIPGLAYAVVQGGKTVRTNAFGTAGGGRPMTVRTPFQAASLAKSFTAAAVMQLAEEGRVELEAPVTDYLPWFRVAAMPDAEAFPIRVKHLLYQTSGLSEGGFDTPPPRHASLEEAVRRLERARRAEPPGEQFHYFNYNYTVLGLLVEKISGLSFSEYMEQEVFGPLEMRNSMMLPGRRAARTRAETAATAESAAQPAIGHGVLFGFSFPRNIGRSAYCGPSGGLITTAEDVSAYMRAQLSGGRDPVTGGRLLSEEALAVSRTPGIGNREAGYAMGWMTGRRHGTEILRHGGSLPGFRSFIWLLPEQDIGIAVLINQNSFLPAILAYSAIPDGLAALMTGGEPEGFFPLRLLYWGLTAAALLLLWLQLRWWRRRFPRLRGGGGNTRRGSRGARTEAGENAAGVSAYRLGFSAALELLLPALLLFGMAPATEAVLDRGMSWELGFEMEPTVMVILCIVIAGGISRAAGKGLLLYMRSKEEDTASGPERPGGLSA